MTVNHTIAKEKHPQRVGLISFSYSVRMKERDTNQDREVLMNTETDIRKRVRSHPGDALSHFWLGSVMSAQGRHEEAEEEYRRVIQLKKDRLK